MKKLLVVISLISLPFVMSSQESYTVDGETLVLKKDVSGTISLLWNIIDGKYRYFVKSDANIRELKNTKKDKEYQEEYKKTLGSFTYFLIDYNNVNLTLPSLRNFFNEYNKQVDPNYKVKDSKSKLESNFMLYGGVTNHPTVDNPENALNPVFGAEIEFFNNTTLSNHALYFGVSHALSSSDFDFSRTRFDLGYRFRFINKEAFNIYSNLTVATYSFSKEFTVYEDEEILVEDEVSGSTLDAPFSIGLGADFKIGKYSFLTFTYKEIVALFIENKGNFPTHFTIGYKINL